MNPNSQTRPEPPTPQRGPERFAAPVVTPEEPSPLRVAGAALALALLILGVPLALWGLTGAPPVPTSVPTREDLTQPLSLDAILVVLRVVVWLAWLQFTVCTTVEVASLVRGGGLPRPVPLSGRSQALARMLVGTVLVGSSVIGTATAASSTPGDLHAHGEQRASATPAAVAEQRDTPKLDRATEAPDGARAESDRAAGVPDHAGVPADMHDVVGRKVAIVKPPQGHYHDNLWDIAERHLGDGRRWKEIFDLNQARQQPDGQQLVLGRLIQPGWVLVMPEDAVGVDRVTQAPSGPRSGGRPHQQAGSTQLEALRHADQHADQHGYHDGYQADATSELPRDLLGGGLLAAAALMVLAGERSRRRGVDPTDDELEAEIALRVGADTDRVVWLDQALRGLSASCRAERIPLPAVYALTVSDEAIELRMAPGQPHAPAPWTPLEEGRRWRLTRVAHAPLEMGNAPYPGLVCLGRDADGADALIDLESIGGLVAFTGSPTVANEVVSAIAVQLATAPWSDERTVHGYHLSPVLTDIDGDS